jgi:hypothetical protein
MSQFQKLLADLAQAQAGTDTLAKSLPAGGEGAGAGAGGEGGEGGAAAGGEGAGGEGGAAGAGEGAGAGGEGGQATLTKSLKVTLADGTEVEAEDGTELVKALMARLDDAETTLTKSLTITMDVIGKQNAMIKSLSEQVTALRGEGRGRKTVIAIHDKGGAAAGGQGAGAQGGEGELAKGGAEVSADDFMLKAHAAYDQKLIDGVGLGTIDVCLRSGQPVPTDLISKVAKAKTA